MANLPAGFTAMGRAESLGVRMPVWLMLGLASLAYYLLGHTRPGRQLYYVGSNARAARLSGIGVERVQIVAFTAMGVIAGLAGLAFAARVGTAVSTAGVGAELRVITAVILGGASLSGGKGRVLGGLIGVAFMALVNNALIITRVSSYWQGIVVGVILVLAVAYDSYQTRSGDPRNPRDATSWPSAAAWRPGPPSRPTSAPSADLPRRDPRSPERTSGDEEYVWISANAHLSLFVARDHPALFQVGRELGVLVTIVGPDAVDIPGLVSALEQTAARRPTGIMVVGWDPTALIPAIDRAIDSGVPVVCVDADVPGSKWLAFIGTDWYDLGVRQVEAMLAALKGRRGEVAMMGLIEQSIDQRAFAGFRSVAEPAGLTVLEPQQDKGN